MLTPPPPSPHGGPKAADMAALAEELFPCRAVLLEGGLGGGNCPHIVRHLMEGWPLLVPYPLRGGFLLRVGAFGELGGEIWGFWGGWEGIWGAGGGDLG